MRKHKYPNKFQSDYEKLFDLVYNQNLSVLCVIDYDASNTFRDVCRCFKENARDIVFSSRGYQYLSAFETKEQSIKDMFIERCKAYHVEFVL